jgi:hypothetical protein
VECFLSWPLEAAVEVPTPHDSGQRKVHPHFVFKLAGSREHAGMQPERYLRRLTFRGLEECGCKGTPCMIEALLVGRPFATEPAVCTWVRNRFVV